MSSENKRQVFITGAGGFIGANLIRALLKNNYAISILIRQKKLSWRLQGLESQITIHYGDITNFISVKKAVQKTKPDYIIHLAVYGAYHFQTDLGRILDINVKGMKNLLEATKDMPYELLINTGSSSEYGYKINPMKETDYCNPVSYYASTKLAATHLAKVFSQINNKPIVTFRLFSVYGPYEEPTRLVPSVMKALVNKDVIKLSPGMQRRDFIYIDDVCEAFLKALQLGRTLQSEICNIGTGIEFTNKELVNRLFAVTQKKTTIRHGSYKKRPWDTPHWKANIVHAKKLLGWKPNYSLDNGLLSTYSWFEENMTHYR